MVDIVRYSEGRKGEWNQFLQYSKNGLFLFDRDYMEYHSDRFIDFSLMVYADNELIGLLPANLEQDMFVSHGGLTFGGFITDSGMGAERMLDIFDHVLNYLTSKSIRKVVYKCIPYIYCSLPAEEDRYALFRKSAMLYRRDATSVIYLPERPVFQKARDRGIKKALKNNLAVKLSNDFKTYWEILKDNLIKVYETKPVHSLQEIENLHRKFPGNIKLFASYQGKTMMAGVVIYESAHVAHAQYIANSEEGREKGALDIVFSYLINEHYRDKRYFDFGVSTEKEGQFLNTGLTAYKESFGARAAVHDFYELNL